PSPVDPDLTVHIFTHAGALHGAFIQVPSVPRLMDADNKNTTGVLASFKVENLEQTLNKVVESGGTVHVPKTPIGTTMGNCARIVDTEGNLQGLWSMN
ncbi:hypothetical protein GQ53DRAFT_885394, partial [Thozetella sp. PMI_491]